MKELINAVISTYEHLYGKSLYEIEEISDNHVIIKFVNQTIELDNFVGGRYRLTFSELDGVIDDFRDQFDEIYGFVYYCCDVSYFIDLTLSFIKKVNLYFKSL